MVYALNYYSKDKLRMTLTTYMLLMYSTMDLNNNIVV
jgi:hypothetical protein